MSLRNTSIIILASLVWLIFSLAAHPQLLALDKGDDLVKLTILYTGDEVGYLEPCG